MGCVERHGYANVLADFAADESIDRPHAAGNYLGGAMLSS